jgi:hypothetical protein
MPCICDGSLGRDEKTAVAEHLPKDDVQVPGLCPGTDDRMGIGLLDLFAEWASMSDGSRFAGFNFLIVLLGGALLVAGGTEAWY